MNTYYNDNDAYMAAWLKELFAGATIDERDIRDITGAELGRYERVHLFAGWPADRPVWTASCP